MPTSRTHLTAPSSSAALQESSSTPSQAGSPTYTPAATPCGTPPASHDPGRDHEADTDKHSRLMTMENAETSQARETGEPTNTVEVSPVPQEEQTPPPVNVKCSHKSCNLKDKKKSKKAKQKKKKKVVEESSDSESSSSSSSDSSSSESEEDESESDDSSEDESTASEPEDGKPKRGRKRQKALIEKRREQARQKAKAKKAALSDSDSTSEESDSEAETETESEPVPGRSKKSRKSKITKKGKKKSKKVVESSSEDSGSETELDRVRSRLSRMKARLKIAERGGKDSKGSKSKKGKKGKKSKKDSKKKMRASKLEFKRVDQLWDSSIHNYKLTDTAEDEDADEYDKYIFTIRRRFDWEDKYEFTLVDIKSKPLKDALGEIMEGVKGVSLVEETPALDPNMLFMYLEEMRTLMKKLKSDAKKQKKKKAKKAMALKAAQLKILVKYLDEDYADTKKTLYPMLENGLCTFDLMWALFKPNTIAYTSTYGSTEEPRAFRIESAVKESSFMRGTWYLIEGKYLEFDGKSFGMGTMEVEVDSFKGSRKITSLSAYPMKYHKDEDAICKQLIERGRKFVALDGMHYRFHNSLAFYKKKKTVIKVNINGRIMVDPSLHRRINPNYPISTIKPEEPNAWGSSDSEDESDCGCGGSSDEDEKKEGRGGLGGEDDGEKEKTKYTWKRFEDEKGRAQYVRVPLDEDGNMIQPERMDKLPEAGKDKQRTFTDDDFLLASPVVLGFAFTEKLWLEFTVSGVHDIQWNEGAFDSLVLPENQKTIVKALVESHKFHGAKNIDDVIQGKGKGLVAVLHGPPGTGKTLTAEGIAELLRCPLYMVSAGELGTDPRTLEAELNKILDIAHAWGAVLLLDEADVFLEERTIQDIHRNALVSIFLRLLEYFQGILFLTTNRVETFDNAFQSRIHVALRYGELTTKAKKSVWKMFLQKVSDKDGVEIAEFKEKDFDDLSRRTLNGRQIKNAVRTAQALAVNINEPLSMVHVKRVLEVAESFDHDLKGGTGYMDAMRSYT